MTDLDCLALMQDLLANRVKIGMAYVQDETTGVFTHQRLTLDCGDLRAISDPEPLLQPMMFVDIPEAKRVVN